MKQRLVAAGALACALALTLAARQPQKPWSEWSRKEAEKILNDSPWGQTQVETDTSEMFYTPTATPDPSGRSRAGAARDERGSTNQATDVKFRIRLFSARPVRQALARLMLLDAKEPNPQFEERMKMFAEMPSNQKIVVAVTFESRDSRFSGPAMQAFNAATAETLRNNTYLERRDGARLFVEQYAPPGKEGFGALFIFPRVVGERSFITADAGDVRFASELGRNLKLNMRFSVAKLTYNGALEY